MKRRIRRQPPVLHKLVLPCLFVIPGGAFILQNHRMSKKELDTLLKTFEQKLEHMSVTNVNNQEEEESQMGLVRYFENRKFYRM